MNKQTIIDTAAKEMRENLPPGWELPIRLDMTNLFVVIGTLQLAMRHPQFRKTPSAKAVREIIDRLIGGIPENCPASKELARLGDNPKFDA
jgi:hypothetical protein